MCIEHLRRLASAAALAAIALPAQAQALKPELSGVAFLLGDWTDGKGKVADTGGSATGASHFTAEAGGGVLLRRDHTELSGAAGRKTGFDQIMMIYPEGGTLHGDYPDGTHVIHYASATMVAGKSVVFASAPAARAPAFRLAYTLAAPSVLEVSFAMAPPGSSTFRPIATGTLTRNGT